MKRMTPMYVIFTGAIIIVIGTVITAIGTLWQNKASSEKSSKQLSKIEALTEKNAELSLQLSNTTLKLNGSITGGDSFCEFFVNPISKESGSISVLIVGENPIYDLTATITDYDKQFKVIKKMGKDVFNSAEAKELKKYDKNLVIGNLIPKIMSEVGIANLDFSGKTKTVHIHYSSRNRHCFQQILFYRYNNKYWITASRIIEVHTNKVLLEKIDPNFPKEPINWLTTRPEE